MAPAASQFGRTAGDNRRYWGGRLLNEKTDGEEARGGERDARAGKVTVDMAPSSAGCHPSSVQTDWRPVPC